MRSAAFTLDAILKGGVMTESGSSNGRAGKGLALAFIVCYQIGFISTFVFLVVERSPNTNGVLSWFLMLGGSGLNAAVWPIYWGIFRWIGF